MTLPSPASEDRALLRAAALSCGDLLKRTAGTKVKTWSKGAAGPVTEIDLEVNSILETALRDERPDYGWLSEETPDNPDRLSRPHVFIIDPIDGTAAFINGEQDFCISVAVVENGIPIAGVVYNPILDEVFEASAGDGAFLNGQRLRVSATDSVETARLIGKRGFYADKRWPRPWPETMRLEHRNALAYRLALVSQGGFDGVLALGPKHEWDIAAGAVLVAEAGGVISDPWGRPHRYNQPDPRLPGVVASGPALHPLLIERVRFMPEPPRAEAS